MRARPTVVRTEAVAAVAALRRCTKRRLAVQRARRTANSLALAVRVEAAPNGRDRAADGSRRRLGVCANDHAATLRDCGVRDLAADFAPVQDLRCSVSAARLGSGASWCDRSSNAQRQNNDDRSHAVPLWQRAHQDPAISAGTNPSGSDCFLCTQDALHGRATIGHGFHSQVVFVAEGFHLCERTFRLFVLRLGVHR